MEHPHKYGQGNPSNDIQEADGTPDIRRAGKSLANTQPVATSLLQLDAEHSGRRSHRVAGVWARGLLRIPPPNLDAPKQLSAGT